MMICPVARTRCCGGGVGSPPRPAARATAPAAARAPLAAAVLIVVFACAAAAALPARALGQARPNDYGDWFVRTYGAAGAPGTADAPLAEEAQRVFSRLVRVADRRVGRTPRLLVVAKQTGLEALALPDGSVVVNPEILRFCLAQPGLPPEHARARLAFVLGHELAHLAYDDAWHAQAFARLRRQGAGLDDDAAGWPLETPEDRRAKELRADRAGFGFLLMAGFSPEGVLDARGTDFLVDLGQRLRGDDGESGAHPSFAERSQLLRAQLGEVVAELPFYRFGVRLLTLGRHGEAIRMLERFHTQIPSREVSANLGLAYYLRALSALADCGSPAATRFRLATLVDPDSVAAKLRLRGDDDACRRVAAGDLEEARRVLSEAVQQDPSHLAARLDLAATLIALERGLAAYEVATGSSRGSAPRAPAATDARLENAAAVALYLAEDELPMDTVDDALEALAALARRLPAEDPLVPAVAFNQARLLHERGRIGAARDAWRGFLRLESSGAWATEAREALRSLGAGVSDPVAPSATAPQPLRDRLSPDLRRRLGRARRQPFTLGELAGAFLLADGVAALELRGTLAVVEETLQPARDVGSLGQDLRRAVVVEGMGGVRTLVLPEIAYEAVDGRLVRRIHYARR